MSSTVQNTCFLILCLCVLFSPAASDSVNCQYWTATSNRSAAWICTGRGLAAAPLEGPEREVEGITIESNGGAPATVLETPRTKEERVSWHPASGMSHLPLGSMVRRRVSLFPNRLREIFANVHTLFSPLRRSWAWRWRLILTIIQPTSTSLPTLLPLRRDPNGWTHASAPGSSGSRPPLEDSGPRTVWHDLRVWPQQQRGTPQWTETGRKSDAHCGQHKICGGSGHLHSST